MSKVSTCLWFGKDAEAAVRFYVSLVPNSSLEHIQYGSAPNWGSDAHSMMFGSSGGKEPSFKEVRAGPGFLNR